MTDTDTDIPVTVTGWMTADKARLLRKPFPEQEIGHRPQNVRKCCTAAQKARQRECDQGHKMRDCRVCHGWHFETAMHLDFVGHAEVTDRLLEVDPGWNWEPLAADPNTGMPLLDQMGGLWIRLIVCGVTKTGYGESDSAIQGAEKMKTVISDAIKNAAMRFGVGLDMWRKTEKAKDEAEKNGVAVIEAEDEPAGRTHGKSAEEAPAAPTWKQLYDTAVAKGIPALQELIAHAKKNNAPVDAINTFEATLHDLIEQERKVAEQNGAGQQGERSHGEPGADADAAKSVVGEQAVDVPATDEDNVTKLAARRYRRRIESILGETPVNLDKLAAAVEQAAKQVKETNSAPSWVQTYEFGFEALTSLSE